jgi:hypothetical protein
MFLAQIFLRTARKQKNVTMEKIWLQNMTDYKI